LIWAVSLPKWKTKDTYPDFTLILPIVTAGDY